MLPPTFKELWKNDFQVLKKEDVKAGQGWMYEADPFQTAAERDEAQAVAKKRRDEMDKQRAKEASQPQVLLVNGGSSEWSFGIPSIVMVIDCLHRMIES